MDITKKLATLHVKVFISMLCKIMDGVFVETVIQLSLSMLGGLKVNAEAVTAWGENGEIPSTEHVQILKVCKLF